MRGELRALTLDKTRVLTFEAIDFGQHRPLMRQPEDWRCEIPAIFDALDR
jgi:hypothetical protein